MHRKGPNSIRILIADDHAIFRDGLRKLLGVESDFFVIGEAGDGAETVKLSRQLKPDVLLLDLAMPRCSGLEALRELETLHMGVRTILLVATIEKEQLIEALELGARGAVLKEATTQLLVKAIRTVVAGQYWLDRENVSDMVQAVRDLRRRPGEGSPPKTFHLTAREGEVIDTIVAGYTNKEIAEKFSISEQTVKHHLTNIFDKLGVSNRLELALFAVHHRLVKGEGVRESPGDNSPPGPFNARPAAPSWVADATRPQASPPAPASDQAGGQRRGRPASGGRVVSRSSIVQTT